MPIDPNQKTQLVNSAGESADTPVLAANVTPSETPVVLDITSAFNVSSAVDLVVWDGTTEFNHTLNGGSAVGAKDLLTESVNVDENLEYNIQYRNAGTVELLQIDERALQGEN